MFYAWQSLEPEHFRDCGNSCVHSPANHDIWPKGSKGSLVLEATSDHLILLGSDSVKGINEKNAVSQSECCDEFYSVKRKTLVITENRSLAVQDRRWEQESPPNKEMPGDPRLPEEGLSGNGEEEDETSHYLLTSYPAWAPSCHRYKDPEMRRLPDYNCLFMDSEETKTQSNLLKVTMAELGFSLEPKTFYRALST